MQSPYAIRRVALKNLRSLSKVDLDITSESGLIRIGGRNGQGKSTAFFIGLSCLLGITQPLPQMTKGENTCYYEIENSYGTFGFRIYRNKTEYYYKLNDGRHDASDVSINSNLCLDVIRAYLGFDLDLDFKEVLNLNSGKHLNFVFTNGRSGLKFLRQLVYSEEIEALQEKSLEDEKRIKKEIEIAADRIHYTNQEIFKIKTVDETWIRDVQVWLNESEEVIQKLNKAKMLNIYIHTCNHLVQSKKRDKVEMYMEVIKYLDTRNKQLRVRESLDINIRGAVKAFPIVNTSMIIEKLKINEYKRETMKNLIKLKEGYNQIENMKSILKHYKIEYLNSNNYRLIYTKKNIKDCQVRLKSLRIFTVKSDTIRSNYNKAILKLFLMNLLKHKMFFSKKSIKSLGDLSRDIGTIKKMNEEYDRKKVELDKKIYIDGRCILCYSKKSVQD